MSFPWMLISVVEKDFLLKSTTISFVLLALIWRVLLSHQLTKSLMTPLYSWSFPSDTHSMMALSSWNFWIWQWSELYLKSEVYSLTGRVRELCHVAPQCCRLPPQTHSHEAPRTVVCWWGCWWSPPSVGGTSHASLLLPHTFPEQLVFGCHLADVYIVLQIFFHEL